MNTACSHNAEPPRIHTLDRSVVQLCDRMPLSGTVFKMGMTTQWIYRHGFSYFAPTPVSIIVKISGASLISFESLIYRMKISRLIDVIFNTLCIIF